jgi:Fe-S cluster assembly iron-binding protein IscA
MLTLTRDAVRYLAEAKRTAGVPESYGLRVAAAPGTHGELQLTVEFAEFPFADDAVSEHDGTRLFVSRDVLDALGPAHAAISVARTEAGSSLVLIDHSGNGSA